MISYPRMSTWEWVWETVQRYKEINNITKWIEMSDEFLKLVVWYEVNLLQLSYFKSWKIMLWKWCTQYARKFGKLSSGHRTGNGQFSLQCQRMFKLPLSYTLSYVSKPKFSKPGFNSAWTVSFQIFKLDLEKAEEPEIKLPISAGSLKKQESSRRAAILLYWLHQSLWLCGSQ